MSRDRRRGAAVLLLLAAAGCGQGDPAPAGPPADAALTGSLTVFAAASLTGPFSALGRGFEAEHPGVRVRFSFAGSSALAQQVIAGAPADVFASASPTTMAQVVAAGDAADPRTFATNRAEVAVAPGSAGRVRTLADLAAPGLKVALCASEVPCGSLARTVLGRAGLSVHPVTEQLDVKAVLSTVESGEVDAGVVYVSDVRAAGDRVVGVPVPDEVNARTDYPIATVQASRRPALARAFRDAVLSAQGRDTLARAGFGLP